MALIKGALGMGLLKIAKRIWVELNSWLSKNNSASLLTPDTIVELEVVIRVRQGLIENSL